CSVCPADGTRIDVDPDACFCAFPLPWNGISHCPCCSQSARGTVWLVTFISTQETSSANGSTPCIATDRAALGAHATRTHSMEAPWRSESGYAVPAAVGRMDRRLGRTS